MGSKILFFVVLVLVLFCFFGLDVQCFVVSAVSIGFIDNRLIFTI